MTDENGFDAFDDSSVDDNPELTEAVRIGLRRAGFEASNGIAGIVAHGEQYPGVLLQGLGRQRLPSREWRVVTSVGELLLPFVTRLLGGLRRLVQVVGDESSEGWIVRLVLVAAQRGNAACLAGHGGHVPPGVAHRKQRRPSGEIACGGALYPPE